MLAMNIWAEETLEVGSEFTKDYLKYKVLTLDEENKSYTVSIVGHTDGLPTELVIPSSVEYNNQSFTVTEIAANTFLNAISITSVTIPATITTIGNSTSSSAFSGCTSLVKVNFSETSTLEVIGVATFSKCTGLTSIEIPSSVKQINCNVFQDCSALTTVTFEDNAQLQSIGCYAFQNCENLTTIEIPSSVTSIGTNAFSECSALSSVTFGEGIQLKEIPKFAFYRCNSLKSIVIPASVKTIGWGAFEMDEVNSSLAEVTFESNSTLETIDGFAFWCCSNLTSVEIPSTVTSLGTSAFDNTGLTEVTLPESLQTMGNYVFLNCTSLTDVTIPATVTSIGVDCFKGCSLTSLTITGETMTTLRPTDFNVEEYSGCILYVNESLESNYYEAGWGEYFTIDGFLAIGVKFTYNGLIYKILTLDEVEDGQKQYTVAVVGYTNDLPTNLSIPSEVQIDDKSFTVTEIAEYAFFNTTITSVTIPATITTIGDDAFDGCSSLETVTFEADSSLEIIDAFAFYNCVSLTSIEIPSSVIEIGWNAFGNCSELETVTFGEDFSPEYFNMYTFYNCTSLTKIEIP